MTQRALGGGGDHGPDWGVRLQIGPAWGCHSAEKETKCLYNSVARDTMRLFAAATLCLPHNVDPGARLLCSELSASFLLLDFLPDSKNEFLLTKVSLETQERQ